MLGFWRKAKEPDEKKMIAVENQDTVIEEHMSLRTKGSRSAVGRAKEEVRGGDAARRLGRASGPEDDRGRALSEMRPETRDVPLHQHLPLLRLEHLYNASAGRNHHQPEERRFVQVRQAVPVHGR